jgi:YidC/Oxa1 family membrane protein insertase
MERRALIAAVLCLIVLIAYQEGVRRLYPPPPEGTAPAATSETSPRPEAAVTGGEAPEPADATAPTTVGEEILVDTGLYSARVSTVGGRLISFRLKNFRTAVERESEPLEMIEVAPASARPLGLRVTSANGKSEDDTTVTYAPSVRQLSVAGDADDRLVLTGTLPSGVTIEKTLVFKGDAYPIDVGVRTSGGTAPPTRIGIGWRHQLPPVTRGRDSQAAYRGAVLLVNNKVVHETIAALQSEKSKSFDPPVEWAGYNDHYFLAAIAAADPTRTRAVVSADEGGVQVLLASDVPADAQSADFSVYVGPKDVQILEASGHQFARAVDFGWFAFLAVPLLRLLRLFHRVTGNYGIDIILLTILVKVLFIPLSNKSMKSMRDMQRLQPQMAKLREKFKDDRERLNKEMIELYRRHRVNPLGGCLPMLLQFPVFIGLYQALNQSIELRHAGFALWLRDLSAHECYPWPGLVGDLACNNLSVLGFPIPLLVILMGASMILQQWLSPSSGMDPTQQRMMMVLMPVMFTVMFVNFPSGLVLYWLVNNLLTVAQQWRTNRATA